MKIQINEVSNSYKLNIKESPDNRINAISSNVPIIIPSENLDHNILYNRDSNDQHPIKSITDLSKTLNSKVNSNDVLTNEEINEIFGW